MEFEKIKKNEFGFYINYEECLIVENLKMVT